MNESFATNPAIIQAKFLRLFRYHPKWYLLWGGLGSLVLVWGLIKGSIWMIISSVIFFVAAYIYHRILLMHFLDGDVNIAKIIRHRPDMFATSANMRMFPDGPAYPVIKIVRHVIPRVNGLDWNQGDYISAVCLYTEGKGLKHWKDVHPIPLSVGTNKLEKLQYEREHLAVLQSELELRLAMIDTPDKPGLYFLDEQKLDELRKNGV